MKNNKYTICVYGSAGDGAFNEYKPIVEELGCKLAKNGYSLVYGAGSTGLMGAAARGFTKGNGEIIGVAPRFMTEFEALYDKCTELIQTDDMAERKSIMEYKADCFLVVPGGIGTLDELFQVLALKQLKRHDKPIIIFDYDGFYALLVDLIMNYIDKGFLNEAIIDMFVVCESPEDVINYLAFEQSE